ncbi:ABC transporter substrate-binding protein [Actinomyces sp. HMSC062G12]|nr:ABC transporter substrate-binding protein [Actinomyces sp. HMSC062G12]
MTITKARVLIACTAALTLSLAACADPTTTASGDSTTTSTGAAPAYDVSSIPTVDEIAALVPDEVKQRGTLRNGASADYAPAEFLGEDSQTAQGYDVDITKALAKVMGLAEGTTHHAEFPTIIPALGTKFDVGLSSFTITSEREEQANLISYVEVGSAFGVAKGNPRNFDPTDPCGKTIGLQTGTAQEDYANELSDRCMAAGKEKITVMPHDLQTDIATKVIGGQYDATFADSTVIGYTASLSSGQLEQIGGVIESAPQGVAINKDDEKLTAAVQKAMQYLMDNGYLKDILATYGAHDAALTTAQLNPATNN